MKKIQIVQLIVTLLLTLLNIAYASESSLAGGSENSDPSGPTFQVDRLTSTYGVANTLPDVSASVVPEPPATQQPAAATQTAFANIAGTTTRIMQNQQAASGTASTAKNSAGTKKGEKLLPTLSGSALIEDPAAYGGAIKAVTDVVGTSVTIGDMQVTARYRLGAGYTTYTDSSGNTFYMRGDDFVNPDTGNTIPSGEFKNVPVNVINALRDANEQLEDRYEDKAEEYEQIMSEPPILMAQRRAQMRNQMGNVFYGRLLSVFNSHFDNVFGSYFASVPYALCGDSLFEVQQDNKPESKGFLPGLLQPNAAGRPEYRSEMERKLLEDIKTVIIEGERSEITPTLYRYAVTLKLIGDQTEEWDLYLYNSCTKENSFNSGESLGWSDTGRITKSQYFGKHYAGENSGNDNTKDILDCTKEKCRFDQACIRFKQPGEGSLSGEALKKKSVCMTLAHGTGFRTVDSRTGTNRC